jgi:hypothetical protein
MKYEETPKTFQKLINTMNKVMSYIHDTLAERNLPSLNDLDYWKYWASYKTDIWTFSYQNSESFRELIDISKTFEPMVVEIKTIGRHTLMVEINFNKKLQSLITNYDEVSSLLMSLFLAHEKITPEILERGFLPEAKIIAHQFEIKSELEGWLYADNYKQAIKHAERLEHLTKYLPEECKRSPSNILYRCVMVNKSLLDKVVEGKKSHLVLRNRLYSSWTYDEEAAHKFGSSIHPDIYKNNSRILVMLKRTFSKDEIMLAVLPAVYAVGIGTTIVKEEKEIIVKNIKKDFKFKPEEIYLLRREKGSWFTLEEYRKTTTSSAFHKKRRSNHKGKIK